MAQYDTFSYGLCEASLGRELFVATAAGHARVVEKCLSRRADPWQRDSAGNVPLHLANEEVVPWQQTWTLFVESEAEQTNQKNTDTRAYSKLKGVFLECSFFNFCSHQKNDIKMVSNFPGNLSSAAFRLTFCLMPARQLQESGVVFDKNARPTS